MTVWVRLKDMYSRCRSMCEESGRSSARFSVWEGRRCSKNWCLAIDDESSQDLSLAQSAAFMAREAKEQWKYIDTLVEFLDQAVKVNDSLFKNGPVLPEKLSAFLGPRMGFNCSYYVKRILKYSGADPCCAIAALIYLDRFQLRHPNLPLTSKTLQRLLLVALMTATKYLEDQTCLNSRWAEIGGIPLRELNQLELEFLFALDFDLALPSAEYSRCAAALLSSSAAAAAAPPPPHKCQSAAAAPPGLIPAPSPPPAHASSADADTGPGAMAGAIEPPQAACATTERADSEPAEAAADSCAGGAAPAEAEAPCGPTSPCPSAERD